MKRFMLLTPLVSLCLVATAQAQSARKVPVEDKIKVQKTYLSIDKFYARRDLDVDPPKTRIVGFVYNRNFRTAPAAVMETAAWLPAITCCTCGRWTGSSVPIGRPGSSWRKPA